MSAALQQPGAVAQGQQLQAQITPEMIAEIFNIGLEQARMILQALPQLCGTAQPQIQQGQEFQNIQEGIGDLVEFQNFLTVMKSPMASDCERKLVSSVDTAVLFEIVKRVNDLIRTGTPTKDALARVTWSDAAKKSVTAQEIAVWILEVLMPRILTPMIQQQQQASQIIEAMLQERMLQEQMIMQRGFGQGQGPMNGTGQAPGQGQGAGGPPQGQNQRQYPWKNSKGDSVKYQFFADAAGKRTFMSDSLKMDIVKDTVKMDENGILTADAVATAAMVQTYMRDGKEQKVLKDPGELKKACDAWYPLGMPCTDQHPEDGMIMNQDEKVGWTTMPVWDEKNQNVRCSVTIDRPESVAKIQKGATDVSIGFFCDLDETPGNFGQDAFDAVQRNIVFNHLAVGLDKGHGRCPDGTCGIQANNDSIDWDKYKHLPCVGDSHYDWLMQDYPPKTEEERAMSHFGITPEKWAKLTEEEKAAYIAKLPDRGSGLDEKLTATQRKELPDSAFCGPGRSFPVPDCAHYTAALRMLPRYEGPGNKAEIKACIMRKGTELGCEGAEDAEMTLHEQLLKEKTMALVEMSKTLSEKGAKMGDKELTELMDGMRELMWKLRDEIAIIRGQGIAVSTEPMKEATSAYGDAAMLQHTISNKGKEETMKAGKFRLMPGYPDTHDHYADLDENGNGSSTENDGHTHKIVGFNVELSMDHAHELVPYDSSEEEPSMTDKEKAEQDKAAAEKAAADEPKNKAKSGDKAEPPAEKPAEKDEASQYVADMIKAEHTKLVDAIMDRNPPKDREFYEKKSLDELKELNEFLKATEGDSFIPAGKKAKTDSTQAVDDAYSKLENKLRTE